MRSAAAIALIAFATAGCNTTSAPAPPPSMAQRLPVGFAEIVPTTGLKVGRLYFSGVGRRPAFSLPDGSVYNEMCYDDFALTAELGHISDHVIDDGQVFEQATVNQSLGVSGGAATSHLGFITNIALSGNFSRERVYAIADARRFSLTDQGVRIVRDNIGDECRDLIKAYGEQGRDVVLVLSAVRAGALADTTESHAGGKINASFAGEGGGIGGGSAASNAAIYRAIFIGINPVDI